MGVSRVSDSSTDSIKLAALNKSSPTSSLIDLSAKFTGFIHAFKSSLRLNLSKPPFGKMCGMTGIFVKFVRQHSFTPDSDPKRTVERVLGWTTNADGSLTVAFMDGFSETMAPIWCSTDKATANLRDKPTVLGGEAGKLTNLAITRLFSSEGAAGFSLFLESFWSSFSGFGAAFCLELGPGITDTATYSGAFNVGMTSAELTYTS